MKEQKILSFLSKRQITYKGRRIRLSEFSHLQFWVLVCKIISEQNGMGYRIMFLKMNVELYQ